MTISTVGGLYAFVADMSAAGDAVVDDCYGVDTDMSGAAGGAGAAVLADAEEKAAPLGGRAPNFHDTGKGGAILIDPPYRTCVRVWCETEEAWPAVYTRSCLSIVIVGVPRGLLAGSWPWLFAVADSNTHACHEGGTRVVGICFCRRCVCPGLRNRACA